MRARTRLAATSLSAVALLGGTVACSGEAPGRDQVERDVAEDYEEGDAPDVGEDGPDTDG